MLFPILLAALVGLLLGSLIAWFVTAGRVSQMQAEGAALSAQLADARQMINSTKVDTDSLRQALSAEQSQRTRAETELQSQRGNLEEQRRLLESAETKLREAFDSLAGRALRESSAQFLQLAQERLASIKQEAAGDLDRRQESIRGLVDPLQQHLADLQTQLREIESSRESAYGELRSQVQQLADTSRNLEKETGALVNTLRQPQAKGRWGELTLRRAVELAGMSSHCDFGEQVSAESDEGRYRADLIVYLPAGRNVVVDAKVPLHGFLNVAAAQSDAERSAGLAEHARLVRSHVAQLASKEYWRQFEPTPEFVVMFVPGESFFSAALEQAPTLLEEAMEKRVVLASPTNLIALLRAVAYGWRQEQLAENAEAISQLGRELYERLIKFVEHLNDVRGGLERANKAFNSAVGTLEGRILPTAQKLKDKTVISEELPPVEPTETNLRTLNPALADGEE